MDKEEAMYKSGGGEALSGFRDKKTGELVYFDEPIYLCDPDYESKVAEARAKARAEGHSP
ncbi:MAG: hypothetical protein FWH47_08200 [Methanomassiliicoccaceae archaeon]|nr:hypothetical protein [Methanomassiliicoccaceae archaeon]